MTKPSSIRSIWDNRGTTQDRYTVVLNNTSGGLFDCLGLDEQPTHPLGFSQYSTCQEGEHLGDMMTWEQLPVHVRSHVSQRLAD